MTAEQLTPRECGSNTSLEGIQGVVEEDELCIESVARHLVPPQQTERSSETRVTQDPDAWNKLLQRRRPAGLGTISKIMTGFERPRGRVERGRGG